MRFTRTHVYNRNFFIILAIDVLLLCASWYTAYLVRFDFDIPEKFIDPMITVLPAAIAIKVICFYIFGVYRGMWRFTSVADVFNILKASALSTALLIVWILLVYRFKHFPRSAPFIDWCFTVLLISGSRMLIRLFFQRFVSTSPIVSLTIGRGNPGGTYAKPVRKRLLIIGAGNCGEKIYREIHDNSQLKYKVVGFLDDDAGKIGKTIHGVPVLGIIGDLKAIADNRRADEVLIAIPSATSAEMRRIVEVCKQSGVGFKTVPSYGELIDGKISVKAIREVAYRDLIGRETVKLDEQTIQSYIHGHRILVTGAGGSIGSELCRQVCRFNPERLTLFEIAESPLHETELQLRKAFPGIDLVPVLGDIQDKDHLDACFKKHRPQTVFHAAAYKHVPMLEHQPWRAIENNIIGTANLVDVSDQTGLERFVLVSTDKAVRPANVMGATKRITEMITLNRNTCSLSNTRFMAVRFGNVVGSVGSVVPLFKKQIEEGGPVTVTHPEITRFFMTIREAAQLILQAGAFGSGGEIFILDMGTPVKIVDMARDLIRLSGFEPDVDIKIEFIGLRPGEKLYEELITADENIMPTQHPKILVLKGGVCNFDSLNEQIRELVALSSLHDPERIRSKLQELVSDYAPANQEKMETPVISVQPSSFIS